MRAIETRAMVGADSTLTITIKVPTDLQAGEYRAMVVLDTQAASTDKSSEAHRASAKTEDEQNGAKSLGERWQKWFDDVEKLPLRENAEDKDIGQILTEKYRKQGLDI